MQASPDHPDGDRGPSGATGPWSVVLPVKGGATAKSRLAASGGLDAALTGRLALAMSLDCLDAVLATPQVARALVVTSDAEVARAAADLGAAVVDQPAARPGLGQAVRLGLTSAGDGPAAVLLPDLPALRPHDLDAVLTLAGGLGPDGWLCVPDADGTGTVLVAAPRTGSLRPAFGSGSAAAHAHAGATLTEPDLPRLRRDVDVAEDLVAVQRLGVGPRTARTLTDVQATVLRWDGDERAGEVVTDDGVRHAMTPDALDGSGLRHLRPGQRVTCSPATAGQVCAVRIRGIES